MSFPKRIEEITVVDLSQHRWCYFHDDEGEYDSFEWVIPETHPKFSEAIMQLELATFRFQGGEELTGMFDGSNCFSVFLSGDWYALWYGVRIPTQQNKEKLQMAMGELGSSYAGEGNCQMVRKIRDLQRNTLLRRRRK